MDEKKCEHKDGWYMLRPDVVINLEQNNDNNIASFQCNTIGCLVEKKFRFDITNIEEVKQ